MNQTATLSPSHEERLIDFKETAHLLGDIPNAPCAASLRAVIFPSRSKS